MLRKKYENTKQVEFTHLKSLTVCQSVARIVSPASYPIEGSGVIIINSSSQYAKIRNQQPAAFP